MRLKQLLLILALPQWSKTRTGAPVRSSFSQAGIAVSLNDIADKESPARLRDRLIVDERNIMAVYSCKKCKVNYT